MGGFALQFHFGEEGGSLYTVPAMIRLGVHASISGHLANAIDEAARLGCTTVQIFSGNPRGWAADALSKDEVRAFLDARERGGITPLVIHCGYLINLASPNPLIRQRSVMAFRRELERAIELRADYLVVHPGSAKDQPAERGIHHCRDAIRRAVRGLRLTRLTILIENTAGQGGQIGRTLEQLADLLEGLDDLPVGLCLDTAHAYATGYDLSTEAGVGEFLSRVDSAVGMDRIAVIHANDTCIPLGGRRDRHWHIGQGQIGLTGFRVLVNHPILGHCPFILETPKKTPDDDPANLAQLKKLVASIR